MTRTRSGCFLSLFVCLALASLCTLLEVSWGLPNNSVSGQTLPQDGLDQLLLVFFWEVLGLQTLVVATLLNELRAGAKFITVIFSVRINKRVEVLLRLLLQLLHNGRKVTILLKNSDRVFAFEKLNWGLSLFALFLIFNNPKVHIGHAFIAVGAIVEGEDRRWLGRNLFGSSVGGFCITHFASYTDLRLLLVSDFNYTCSS